MVMSSTVNDQLKSTTNYFELRVKSIYLSHLHYLSHYYSIVDLFKHLLSHVYIFKCYDNERLFNRDNNTAL